MLYGYTKGTLLAARKGKEKIGPLSSVGQARKICFIFAVLQTVFSGGNMKLWTKKSGAGLY